MDSLLASYASSDDEDHHNPAPSIPISSSSLFSSLPKPKPNSTLDEHKFDNPKKLPLFSSIPKPQQSELSKPPKRVVQFKPPVNPINDLDDDEDDEIERKRRKESQPNSHSGSSVLSFLSTIPAPKNSSQLGALPSASGSARRSNIGLETTPTFNSTVDNDQNEEKNVGFVSHEIGFASSGDNNNNNNQEVSYDDSSGYDASYYGDYGNYYEGEDGNNWGGDGAVYEITEPSVSDNLIVPGKKRRKNEMATQIIEVTQDELTKNRPREDQTKLTGIAFGPSYQPASSTKGKPSKLHKRKHQIGSLYFDMKQKETELAERRAKGFLTKAQTHAKYGW